MSFEDRSGEEREDDGRSPFLLSPAGRARREAMLRMLKREVVRRRERRTAVRWGALAVLIGLGALPVAVGTRERARVDMGAVEPRPAATRPGPPKKAGIEVIADRPGVIERYRVETTPLRAGVRIDDEELLSLLAEAGHPSGLIRIRDTVILTPDIAGGL